MTGAKQGDEGRLPTSYNLKARQLVNLAWSCKTSRDRITPREMATNKTEGCYHSPGQLPQPIDIPPSSTK